MIHLSDGVNVSVILMLSGDKRDEGHISVRIDVVSARIKHEADLMWLHSPIMVIRGPRALAAGDSLLDWPLIAERAGECWYACAQRLWRRDSCIVRRLVEYCGVLVGRGQVQQVIRCQAVQARVRLIRGERRVRAKRRVRRWTAFICSTFTGIGFASTAARMRSTNLAMLALMFSSQSVQDRIHNHEASRATDTRRTWLERSQHAIRGKVRN